MAPKAKGKPAPKGKAAKRGSSGGLEIFKTQSTWWTIFTVVVIALLVVFRQEALDFFASVRYGVGLGSIFIVVYALTIIILVIRRSLGTFIKHWNIWLGSVAFVFAVWGILGFIQDGSGNFRQTLGGHFGFYLIGGPTPFDTAKTFIGIVIILAFVILGFLLVAPRITLKVFSKIYALIKGTPKKPVTQQPQPRTTQPVKPRWNARYSAKPLSALNPSPARC